MKKFRKKQKGVSLIEVIVGVAVFAIIAVAFYVSINVIIDSVEVSRRRTVSTNLANEQMEILRNMPYSELGVINGNPAGDIPATQTKEIDGIEYVISTYISYFDDPYDGLFPTDPYSADYKKARVEVCWTGTLACSSPTILISNFSTNSIETGEGTGVMKINVRNKDIEPVEAALVTIERESPAVYIQGYTNSDGELFEPLLDPSTNDYHVTVTKDGYSTDYTVPVSPEIPNPFNRDVSIIEGDLTEVTLLIDELSSLTIQTRDINNNDPLPNIEFQMIGTDEDKILGNDSEGNPVYKFDEVITTDENGVYTFDNNLEWNTYELVLDGESAENYSLAGSAPPGSYPQIIVEPGTSRAITIYLDGFSPHNLLMTVTDAETGDIITEADAQMFSVDPEFDKTKQSNSFGQVWFPTLETGTYDLNVSKDGYSSYSDPIEIIEQQYINIELEPL